MSLTPGEETFDIPQPPSPVAPAVLASQIAAAPFNNVTALAEGWDLFNVDGRLQLQRIDSPGEHADIFNYSEPKFPSDAAAIIHVAHLARLGSAYHMEALHLIGTLCE